MSTIAFDQFALTRIADFARSLSRLHRASRRRLVEDDQIDREFNAVCMSIWGYTTDDFSDDLFSDADHAWLDSLDEAHARRFAAEQGYDLIDDQGMLTDWWGLLLDDPCRKAGTADAGKSGRRARANRGKISVRAERDRRDRRSLIPSELPRRRSTGPLVLLLPKRLSARKSGKDRDRGLVTEHRRRSFRRRPARPSSRQAEHAPQPSGPGTTRWE